MLSDVLLDAVSQIEDYEEEEEKRASFVYKRQDELIRRVKLDMLILELIVSGELPPSFNFDNLRNKVIAMASNYRPQEFSHVFRKCIADLCDKNNLQCLFQADRDQRRLLEQTV
ncbi:MAG: hypothetical protein ABSG67_03125 [Thermoguttaceae bacterium]|jgi:hypothetical protein